MGNENFKRQYQYHCHFPNDDLLDTYVKVWLDYYETCSGPSDMMISLRPNQNISELWGKWLLAKKLAYKRFEESVV